MSDTQQTGAQHLHKINSAYGKLDEAHSLLRENKPVMAFENVRDAMHILDEIRAEVRGDE